MTDSFHSHGTLAVDGRTYAIARLRALERRGFELARLPFAHRILLENLLRREDGVSVRAADVEAVAGWRAEAEPASEIAFMPARVLLQDFTGVPCVVDLAAMRDAMAAMGGDPRRINPLQPVELVIDHSVQVDAFGTPSAFAENAAIELERNRERYAFLRWGQSAFDNFQVVPPDTGIVHQVNLEYLARVVMTAEVDGKTWAFPDTLVGTDSHTTMVNALGVLGWGVGGIEAEAAMLGQPVTMLLPQVVGMRLTGKLAEGATATDLVLTVTQKLRAHGVVGKFVEFFGSGLAQLSLSDRATVSNMAPEYGATCGIFPIDAVTLAYLRLTGRDEASVRLVEAYAREQGLFHEAGAPEARYSSTLELDLATVEPSLAGPKRPQDRLGLGEVKRSFVELMRQRDPAWTPPARSFPVAGDAGAASAVAVVEPATEAGPTHGSVVIAAITSCTNTSNPDVMLAAGLVARKANALGLKVRPWVKTSLAPGSQVVTDYLARAGLLAELEAQRFHLVGYGCTTCIGNSGPLPAEVAARVEEEDLVVAAVLSGNRNFEGRVHAQVRANYLASPPLVVAYALAGRVDFDPKTEPLGRTADGKPVFLRDVWPSRAEVAEALAGAVGTDLYRARYADVYRGTDAWRGLDVPRGDVYAWDERSSYVRSPPYFEDMPADPPPVTDIEGARCLVLVGDSITTDHISPAGSIKPDSPAGRYLQQEGVAPKDFNSYGARRGNHEVMVRGTFANVRLKNRLTPGIEGSSTLLLPEGRQTSIFDAAMAYRDRGVPSVVIAGKEYGTGSSRDWAAKGPALLGVRAVLAQSFERIHRSNLVGMGILPLELPDGASAESLGLDGKEEYAIGGVRALLERASYQPGTVSVRARRAGAADVVFTARVRIDTPVEAEYYRHRGILPYVLRKLVAGA